MKDPVSGTAIHIDNARHSTSPAGWPIVLPSEDLAAFRAFSKRFFDDLKPRGMLEEQLVQTLADCSWRLNRIRAIEINLLTLGQTEAQGSIITDHPEADRALANARAYRDQTSVLEDLSVMEERLTRQFDKAFRAYRQRA